MKSVRVWNNFARNNAFCDTHYSFIQAYQYQIKTTITIKLQLNYQHNCYHYQSMMNIDRQSLWVCVYVSECICVLVICYRNHTYHVCLIFFSSPGHKMTSLHKRTANTNLVFINFFVHLLILNVQHKIFIFEQKTRLISCS